MSQVTVMDFIALVFDFDDTLMPDSTTKFLESRSIDPKKFWSEATDLLKQGYDQPSAYLKLMLDQVGKGKKLAQLKNSDLAKFGATLEGQFYSGLPRFFRDVKRQVKTTFANIEVEFYLISGGLQPMLEGIPTLKRYFSGIYGCKLGEDPATGAVSHIKRSITFTEKTRYLFEINKGIPQAESEANPFLVNKDVPSEKRRIPFKNIAFVGDGLTDIPCFSLIQKMGGSAFGVFDPSKQDKTKRAFQEFLLPHRVNTMHAPKFGPKQELGSMLRMWVSSRATDIELERQMALKP
jgi:hypothetical protein